MLGRDARGGQDGLQLRDVQPEDSHAEREHDRGEQQQVLSPFIEGRRMLEDAQATGAEGHQAEPLPAEVSVFIPVFSLCRG